MATGKGEYQFPSKMGPLSSYLCASRWPSTYTNSGLGATATTKQKPYKWSWEEMIERMGKTRSSGHGEHGQSTPYAYTKFSQGKGAWKEGRMDLSAVASLEPEHQGGRDRRTAGACCPVRLTNWWAPASFSEKYCVEKKGGEMEGILLLASGCPYTQAHTCENMKTCIQIYIQMKTKKMTI